MDLGVSSITRNCRVKHVLDNLGTELRGKGQPCEDLVAVSLQSSHGESGQWQQQCAMVNTNKIAAEWQWSAFHGFGASKSERVLEIQIFGMFTGMFMSIGKTAAKWTQFHKIAWQEGKHMQNGQQLWVCRCVQCRHCGHGILSRAATAGHVTEKHALKAWACVNMSHIAPPQKRRFRMRCPSPRAHATKRVPRGLLVLMDKRMDLSL